MDTLPFPEKDMMCPNDCFDKGGFKMSPKIQQQVVDVNKEAEYAKELAESEDSKLVAQQPTTHKEDMTTEKPEPQEEHMLQLKPGINGKVDWSSLAALTGTRPLVNKYSLSRFSFDEWRNHNEAVLSDKKITEAHIMHYNVQTAIMSAFGNIDKRQLDNNKRLKQKAKDIFRWKVEVDLACKAITREVELLEIDRQRIKGASRVLMLPESISRECIELRSNRAVTDLVEDLPEQELLKEMRLVGEVRQTLRTTLQKIEDQLAINKAAKHRIEYDWCDKTMAHNTEATNLGLSTNSNTLMFRPGAVKFADYTAPLAYWEYFCRENIKNVEAVRQSSEDLRSTLNAILINNGRKLRDQADMTDMALAQTIANTSEMVTKMEEHLRHTLQSIADIELLTLNLHTSIRKTDAAMKLAQTRLDNRNNWRPHEENVRDQPHLGLIKEVKVIHETVTSLLAQLNNAEKTRKDLMQKRRDVERDIASKRKTLNIDRERCGMIRSHYPTASELAGF